MLDPKLLKLVNISEHDSQSEQSSYKFEKESNRARLASSLNKSQNDFSLYGSVHAKEKIKEQVDDFFSLENIESIIQRKKKV